VTIGSLFSGIGGLELGLEWAGVGHTVWQVEQSDFCRGVLGRHWPSAIRHEDVHDVGMELEHVEVICGGFPCQDISTAGKGAGIDGPRSGLWREFARIIGVVRPNYVVIENVSALVVRGLDRVLADLAAMGFDAEWHRLGASDVGAAHRRWRLFIIAWRRTPDAERVELRHEPGRFSRQDREGPAFPGNNGAAQPVADVSDADADGRKQDDVPERGAQKHPVPGVCSKGVADPDGARSDDGAQLPTAQRRGLRDSDDQAFNAEVEGVRSRPGEWLLEPDVGRVADGVPARVDRIRALGNAVVPQCAEVVGRRLLEIDRRIRNQ